MAMTLDELKKLFEAEDIKYFVDPNRAALLASFRGIGDDSHRVLAKLELDGMFLQFRTIGWLSCPDDHPSLTAVLKVIGAENYRRRLVKLGWDPADGELVAYADVWLMDGKLTKQQFSRILHNYLPVMDLGYLRLKKTIETGHDPGQQEPGEALKRMLEGEGRGLPDAVRELLEKLRGKGDPDSDGDDDDVFV